MTERRRAGRRRSGLVRRLLLETGPAVAAAAVIGTAATDPDSRWARRLDRPDWEPPQVAFPVVWSGLYTGIAVTSAAVIARCDREIAEAPDAASRAIALRNRARYRRALAANLVLNAGWCVVFWRGRDARAATAVAVALSGSTAVLARRAGRARPVWGWSLVPYLTWTGFAAVLTADIARRNPSE